MGEDRETWNEGARARELSAVPGLEEKAGWPRPWSRGDVVVGDSVTGDVAPLGEVGPPTMPMWWDSAFASVSPPCSSDRTLSGLFGLVLLPPLVLRLSSERSGVGADEAMAIVVRPSVSIWLRVPLKAVRSFLLEFGKPSEISQL